MVLIHSPNASPGGMQTLLMKYLCRWTVTKPLGRVDQTCTTYSGSFTVISRSRRSSQISIFSAPIQILFWSLLKQRASHYHSPWNNSFPVWTKKSVTKSILNFFFLSLNFCAFNDSCSFYSKLLSNSFTSHVDQKT